MRRRGSRAGSRDNDAAAGASDDGFIPLSGAFRRMPSAELDELRRYTRVHERQIHFGDALQRVPPDPGRQFQAPDIVREENDMTARPRLYEELWDFADPMPSAWQTVHGYPHKNRDFTLSDVQEPVQANPGVDVMEFIKSRVT